MNRIAANIMIMAFMLLSAVDFALTKWLVQDSGHEAYESNPVAQWWLTQFGWHGLAGYKISNVLIVIGMSRIVSAKRPQLSRQILGFACAATGVVVVYSATIGLNATAPDEETAEEMRCRQEENRQAQQKTQASQMYIEFVDQVRGDLHAGRSTLSEAVDQLMSAEKNHDPTQQRVLIIVYRGQTVAECLAIQLMNSFRRWNAGADPKRIEELECEYEILFRPANVHRQSFVASGNGS
jgi:hypothetical protein